MTDLWPATQLSIQIALSATLLATLIAVPVAFTLARWAVPGRSLIETLLTVPLVLPPTVVGFLILMLAGARSPIAKWIERWLGIDYSIAFSFHGAVIAATVVSLPLVYLPTRSAFAHVEREMEDVARLFGANLLQVFWHVSLPMARRGLAAGLMLAFARSLGEFGATVMVFGMFPDKQTLPISIYADYINGDFAHAAPAMAALSAISLVIIFVYNRTSLTVAE